MGREALKFQSQKNAISKLGTRVYHKSERMF